VTPDHPDLRAEIPDLLHPEDAEIRRATWEDARVVAIEALRFHCSESLGKTIYIGDVAKAAEEILSRRGANVQVDPGAMGKTLRSLGLTTGPRDASGVKLRLSDSFCRCVQELCRRFDIPGGHGDNMPSEA
jgi:hypothetical protein